MNLHSTWEIMKSSNWNHRIEDKLFYQLYGDSFVFVNESHLKHSFDPEKDLGHWITKLVVFIKII